MITITGIDFFALSQRHFKEAEQAKAEGDRYCEWFHTKEAQGYRHTYMKHLEKGKCAQHPDDANRYL